MGRVSLSTFVCLALVTNLARPAAAAVVFYKEGALDPFTALTYTGVQDTMMITQGGNTTDNFGQRGDFNVGRRDFAGGGTLHDLIRFPITSFNGQFNSINSVTLRLYTSAVITVGPETVRAHRILPADTG